MGSGNDSLLNAGKTLNVNKAGISDIAFINKMLQMTDFTFLEELNIADNNLGDFGARQLCDVLKDSNTIRVVNVSGNGITSEGL